MPRQLRIEYHGAVHHVMSRGDRREKIFLGDGDCQDFLKTMAQRCQKIGFLAHAYCLMPNHFHRVVQTPEANRVAGLAWLWSTYTIGFNQRHKLSGHLFMGSGTPECPRENGHRRPVAASNDADPQVDKDAWKNRLGLGRVSLLSTNRARWDKK